MGRLEVSILSSFGNGSWPIYYKWYQSSTIPVTGKSPATTKSPKNNQEDDLDGFLEGFGPEISPLPMLQRASKMVSFNHSNPHPPMKFMRSLEKGFVRFVMNIMIRNMNVVTKDIHSSSYI